MTAFLFQTRRAAYPPVQERTFAQGRDSSVHPEIRRDIRPSSTHINVDRFKLQSKRQIQERPTPATNAKSHYLLPLGQEL